MAAGLPVVATGVGCLPDLVEEGRTGFLVPPREADRLAARLVALLADRGMRRRMGAAGRARVEEEFDERRVAEKIEELYYGVCDG
jgi:glycosyltransferase involved in cell wall biosynthesis